MNSAPIANPSSSKSDQIDFLGGGSIPVEQSQTQNNNWFESSVPNSSQSYQAPLPQTKPVQQTFSQPMMNQPISPPKSEGFNFLGGSPSPQTGMMLNQVQNPSQPSSSGISLNLVSEVFLVKNVETC